MKRVESIKTDYLIIGAGVIGSAVALGLVRQGVERVTVIDLDLAGEWSSSELNAGGVRATWSQKVNLLTSKITIEYFASHAAEVGYRDCGYLWLHRQATWENALKAREMHVANGWAVDVLDVKGIQKKAPFIDKTDDLVGGIFGVKDGLVNPNRLKEHYREEAMKKGARFLDGVWMCSLDRFFQFFEKISSEKKKNLLTQNPSNLTEKDGQWIQFEVDTVVNCAGAWAPHLATLLGYNSPSTPLRRQISLFHARDLDLSAYGMIIDPSGVYFHPEAIYGLAGFASADHPGFNFEYEGETFFQEQIWAPLYDRSSAFESLKHISGWAGLYENSPDHHAIVGSALPGGKGPRIFEAHSFSGHGVMQSYGVGVSLAELMVKGKYETLDLSPLAASRFKDGKAIESETWVI